MSELKMEKVDPYMLGLHDAVLSGWYDQERGQLMTGFPVGPMDVVVDVGSGDGGAAAFCGRQGAHVILCDIDAARLEGAATRVQAASGRAPDTYVTDAAPLPLADETASRVVCTEVLEHVDDPAAFMGELVRIGRPGALYLITVPGEAQERIQEMLAPPQYFQKPNHIRIFEQEEFHALIEGAGLVIEQRSAYGFFWSLWFAFFWQTEAPLGGTHPLLDAWAATWAQVLAGKDGLRIKAALDHALPKAQVVVARKPA
jgi:SAM-dependent methyltransferase